MGLAAGVGHEERQLAAVPGLLEQTGQGRQVARRLGGEAHHQPAHLALERLDAAAGPQDAVVQDRDVVGDALHVIQQVGRKEDRALAAAGEVEHGLQQ